MAFLKHSDLVNAVKHIQYHKDDMKEKSLNSALFQIVIALVSVFVVFSTRSYFPKALVLSTFANTVYVMFEYYYGNKLDEWFWTFKTKPSKQGFMFYVAALVFIFCYCLYVL